MQLRIGFAAPTKPQTLSLTLAGLIVLVEPDDGNYDLASEYLTAAGIPASIDPGKGLHFMVKSLTSMKNLPSHVDVRGDELLTPLIELVKNPSADGLPATLMLDENDSLRLAWFDGNSNHEEMFLPNASAALLSTEISFVATSETWDALKSYCRLPLIAGRARMNLDGYIEIATTKPQLVEMSPLPALFRIDETHFGLPFAYAKALDSDHSFIWEGHKPSTDSAPETLASVPLTLSGHSEADLLDVVTKLAAQRATVLSWESGLGRRVFSLAAIESLDAFPLLIVASPSAVWAWQRHLDLFGRTYALTHDRADVHIITYRDLVNRPLLASPAAVIFDGLSAALAESPDILPAIHRLDGVQDAYRIACDSDFPDNLEEAIDCMSILRPGEFRSDISVMQRYPVHTEKRAREHIDAYVSRRTSSEARPTVGDFKRSSVISLETTETQAIAFEQAMSRARDPEDVLVELLAISSAGPPHSTSPKVIKAAARARKAHQEGRPIALLTRHSRTAQLLKSMLRPLPVTLSEEESVVSEPSAITVVRFDIEIPKLNAFQEVVVIDYPWSTQSLERSVGSAAENGAPQHVVCLHLEGSVDDRLAMLAARRRERASVSDGSSAPSREELMYLLAPRN